ncbi:MAG: hypothetical protein ACK4Q5_14640 [Saprospiraceae bacterium]
MNIVEMIGFSGSVAFQRGLAMRTVPFLILIVTGVLINHVNFLVNKRSKLDSTKVRRRFPCANDIFRAL